MSRENKRALSAFSVVVGSVLIGIVVGGNVVQIAFVALGIPLAVFGYAIFREAGVHEPAPDAQSLVPGRQASPDVKPAREP